jgi:hypothetical protein
MDLAWSRLTVKWPVSGTHQLAYRLEVEYIGQVAHYCVHIQHVMMFSPREIPLPTSPLSPGSRRSPSITSVASSFYQLPPPELSPRSLFRPRLDRAGTSHTLKADSRHEASPPDPFKEGATISVNQPVGSLSISPSSRDVCLASRKGLYILDLANLNNAPRFIPQGGTWQIAE